MTTFKRLQFGFVPTEFSTNAISNAEQILLSYLRSLQADTRLLFDVDTTTEVFTLTQHYIGKNFRLWLGANYGSGSGVRATLCNAIVNWVEGNVSGKLVITELKRDLNRLNYLDSYQSQSQSNTLSGTNDTSLPHTQRFEKIESRHLYAFMALLGPELLAHFCLSISGNRLATV